MRKYSPQGQLSAALARKRSREAPNKTRTTDPNGPAQLPQTRCVLCEHHREAVRRRLERRRRITPSGCWEWTGTAHRDGTGLIRLSGKLHRVHRVAHRVYLGRPAPTALRHRCKNPKCFNPNHLQEETT